MAASATQARGLALLVLAAPALAGLQLQKRAATGAELEGAADPCACMVWQDAYNVVECGSAQEYTQVVAETKMKDFHLYKKWEEEWGPFSRSRCNHFFGRLQSNVCVNVEFNATDDPVHGGQWCYVSSECKELRGGAKVAGSELSWKICSSPTDELLRDKTVQELDELHRKWDLDLSVLVTFAYPVWRKDSWAFVEEFWGDMHGTMELMSKGRQDLLHEQRSKKPMVWLSPKTEINHLQIPHYITIGTKQIYKVDFRTTPEDARALTEYGHLAKATKLECDQGCGAQK